MRREYSESEAASKAATLCAAGEQCIAQIADKLTRWGQSPETTARIVDMLVEERFIDERRFARAYALDKFRYNGWGRLNISRNLRHLGISEADQREGIGAIEGKEYRQALRTLLAAKARSVKAKSTYERNGKLVRFALGRGFEMDEIMRCLPGEADG